MGHRALDDRVKAAESEEISGTLCMPRADHGVGRYEGTPSSFSTQ